jgi:hypothetical protein
MNTYGMFNLNEFKDLLTEEEYKMCENRPKPYAWYPLTSDVFIRFLNRVSIFNVLLHHFLKMCHVNALYIFMIFKTAARDCSNC